MRTYLVTGGAGFIGSNYIHYMFKKYDNDIRIINVDALTYAGNLENLKSVEERENYITYKEQHSKVQEELKNSRQRFQNRKNWLRMYKKKLLPELLWQEKMRRILYLRWHLLCQLIRKVRVYCQEEVLYRLLIEKRSIIRVLK